MTLKQDIIRTVGIVLIAAVVAIVANGFAGRSRKLLLPGYYPDALRVPKSALGPAPAEAATVPVTASQPASTATVATATMATDTTASAAPVATATTATTATVPPAATGTAPVHATAPTPTAAKPATTAPAVAAAPAKPINVLERFPPHPDKAYVEIDYADVAALHASGALFLDARRTSVWKQGHIAGARSFSVWESDIDEKVNKLFDERSDPQSQAQPIVVYCSGGACEDSHMLAQKLWGIQFNNVLVYKDGYPDWQKRGGAVRTGGQP